MGGRGGTGTILTPDARYYVPYKFGQITKKEAGAIYRAAKEGNITVKPETTRELYSATDAYLRFAGERYNQNHLYYERIYDATRAILNKDFKKAQKLINYWEKNNIDRATKKSMWYKYQKE